MRVLVTGGLGGLGRHVARHLARAGDEVTILGHSASAYARWFPPGSVHYGDIRDPGTYRHLLPEQDAVIHLSFLLPPRSEAPGARVVNVGGTRQLLATLREENPACHLFFASSVTVFGVTMHEPPPVTIDHPVRATNAYTRHKIECERLVASAGGQWTIFRVAEGLYLEITPSLGNLRRALHYSWDQRVEFVHLADVARAFHHALHAPKSAVVGQKFIIGGGLACQMTYHEQLTRLMRVFHLEPPPRHKFNPRPSHLDWYDTRRSQALFQYQTRTFDDYVTDLRSRLGWKRALYWVIAPLARAFLRYCLRGCREAVDDAGDPGRVVSQ